MNIQLGTSTTAGTFNYYQDGSTRSVVDHCRPIDVNGDGVDEVLFYGFETQPNTSEGYSNTNVALFGWVNGQFVDVTAQWLPNGANQVAGVGDAVCADFNNDGKLDIFLSGYTDMDHYVANFVLMNKGTYFEKIQLGFSEWQHGAAAVDFNRDGYMDVMTVGWDDSPALYLGSANGLQFKQTTTAIGSDIVFGNFLGDGSITAVITDHAQQPNNADIVLGQYFTTPNGNMHVKLLSNLPPPAFETKYKDLPGLDAKKSHDFSALVMDFNNDGLDDVVAFGSVQNAGDVRHEGVELADLFGMQFYANRGGGKFEDVTDSTRVGHTDMGHLTYSPLSRDFNSDGKLDIWTHKLYLQNDQGQYVAVGNELFANAVKDTGTIARGPDGAFYLVTSQDSQGIAQVNIAKISFDAEIEHTQPEPASETPAETPAVPAEVPAVETSPTTDIQDDSIEAQIIRLYDAAFDRTPDQGGFDFWVDQMQSGMPLSDVSESFITSTEFELLYGSATTNSVFVTNLYNNVLERDPDPAGLDWWTDNMDMGLPRSNVLLGFSESAEYIDLMQLHIDIVAASLAIDPWGGG